MKGWHSIWLGTTKCNSNFAICLHRFDVDSIQAEQIRVVFPEQMLCHEFTTTQPLAVFSCRGGLIGDIEVDLNRLEVLESRSFSLPHAPGSKKLCFDIFF
jgi:hypothetical protein